MFDNKFFLKSSIGALLILLFAQGDLRACDVCGCGPGGMLSGILPQFDRNFVGIRHQQQTFVHPDMETSMNGESQVMEDFYRRTDMWMRFYPSERWQMFVHVPYQINSRKESLQESVISGVGDISVSGLYALVNTGDSILKDWKNTLLIGGGVFLPTGKYQQRNQQQQLLPNPIQVGRGSFAAFFHAIHTLRYREYGLNTDVRYQRFTENELFYLPGYSSSVQQSFFWWKKLSERISILPNAGYHLEAVGKDTEYGQHVVNTGGSAVLGHFGLDIYAGRVVIQTSMQLPVKTFLNEYQPALSARWSIGLAMFL